MTSPSLKSNPLQWFPTPACATERAMITEATYQDFLRNKTIIDPPTGLDEIPPLNENLFPFQRVLVEWALRRGRAALFASTGLGKTLMMLSWADAIYQKTGHNVLILAPLGVVEQTVGEGAKFGVTVKSCREQSQVVDGITITNYDKLENFDSEEFGGIILDESSCLANETAKRRCLMIESFKNAPFKLACSATPAPNDFMELGSHAEFLGVLSYTEMLSTFFFHDGGDTQSWYLKRHAEEDFWRWMCSWSVMVRHPRDLGFEDDRYDLPSLRMHQIVVSSEAPEGQLFAFQAAGLGERLSARRESIDRRVDACAEIVNESPDGSWLIWCNLNDEADKACKAINGAIQVKGSESPEEKARKALAFARGEIRILVSKPAILGMGLNFQACHQMAFLGLSDSFRDMFQCIRRCYRFGQTQEVDVHVITSEAEGSVVENIKRKERDAERMASEMLSHMSEINGQNIRGLQREKIAYFPTVEQFIPSWLITGGK
jgi:Helicase conserved C-terminal domain/SNF2-related domain